MLPIVSVQRMSDPIPIRQMCSRVAHQPVLASMAKILSILTLVQLNHTSSLLAIWGESMSET